MYLHPSHTHTPSYFSTGVTAGPPARLGRAAVAAVSGAAGAAAAALGCSAAAAAAAGVAVAAGPAGAAGALQPSGKATPGEQHTSAVP